nr:MAG TPA: hypothetical protein [Caudoviricetes sp.]
MVFNFAACVSVRVYITVISFRHKSLRLRLNPY